MRPLFHRQLLHLVSLAVLLCGVLLMAQLDGVREGRLWLDTTTVLWMAIGVAVAHQVYVWLVWRVELHYDWITRNWSTSGFRAFTLGFVVLGLGRIVFISWLAIANRNTLGVAESIGWLIAGIFLVISMYCFYSVHRYFGLERAVGLDHFDPDARDLGLVDDGIFRYTSNGMYTAGFLVLWVPGLLFGSIAAIVAATFHHAYIWVHYYCTELPDMEAMYG